MLTLVADDLTGACDSGALFSGPGPVGVLTDGLTLDPGWDVVSADTESRPLEPGDAAKRVWETARRLQPRLGHGLVFKKIDSTMRGPVAAELDALLLATGLRAALVCPAFPVQGRTVMNGVLRVGGRPAHETPIGQDPYYPGATSSVLEMLEGASERPVRHVPLREVRWGRDALARLLTDAGDALIAADAETESDLDAIARAATDDPSLLLAGSAGMARALAGALDYPAPSTALPPGRGWLIVAGSLHPATRAQIKALADSGVTGLWVDGGREPSPDPAIAALRHGRPAFVATREPRYAADHEAWAEMASQLALVVAHVVAEAEADVLAVTGGATAWALLQALEATRLEVTAAPSSGLALGDLVVKQASTLSLLTKAGGFGAPDLFLDLMKATR
ncbi:MAG TPA: four-carbon acid sugar kinase family protein [Methylomirabilota bacterium]|nr:four-carbon acid sugar kinase family protein [Methylomirabilota bacterium]